MRRGPARTVCRTGRRSVRLKPRSALGQDVETDAHDRLQPLHHLHRWRRCSGLIPGPLTETLPGPQCADVPRPSRSLTRADAGLIGGGLERCRRLLRAMISKRPDSIPGCRSSTSSMRDSASFRHVQASYRERLLLSPHQPDSQSGGRSYVPCRHTERLSLPMSAKFGSKACLDGTVPGLGS